MKLLHKFKAGYLCFLILVCIAPGYAQKYNLDWVNAVGGKGRLDEMITSITVGKSNHIYSVGDFADTLDFDPGSGSMLLPEIQYVYSTFIYKTDASGRPKWVKKFSNTGDYYNNPKLIATDDLDNIYIAGRFTGTVDFNPGDSVYNLTAQASDIFIVKLDSGGNFIWAKNIDGRRAQYLTSSKIVCKNDYVYITGSIQGTSSSPVDSFDFDPDATVAMAPISNQNLPNIYILKLDTSGNYNWAKTINFLDAPATVAEGTSVAVDNAENVIITGFFTGAANFDPGRSNDTLSTAGPNQEIYIMKLTSTGGFAWAKSTNTTVDPTGLTIANEGRDIATDVYNNIYVTGNFGYCFSPLTATVDFNPNSDGNFTLTDSTSQGDIFILKLNTDGNVKWVKQIGGAGGPDLGFSISVSNLGIVATSFSINMTDTIDFDPNSTIFNVTSALAGAMHHGICLLDTSGKFIWGGIMAPSTNYNYDLYRSSIAQDLIGNVYLGGYYSSLTRPGTLVDFDPTSNSAEVNYGGGYDVFLFKLSRCTVENVENAQGCNSYVFRGRTYTQDGVFTDTTHIRGICDSIFTLNLNLGYATIDTLNISSCDSFNFNSRNYTASGFYTNQFTTAIGNCDSIVVINLAISGITPDTAVAQSGTTLTSFASNSTYQWLDCSNGSTPVSGATSQSFTPTKNGQYSVVVTGNEGCTDTSFCYSITGLTGVDGLITKNTVHLYPSPAQEQVTIEMKQDLQNGRIQLMTLQGQILLQQTRLQGKRFHMDISPFAAGIYVIKISEGDQVLKLKLTKQ